MSLRATAIVASVAAASVCFAPAVAASQTSRPRNGVAARTTFLDPEPDIVHNCIEPVPEAASVAHVAPGTPPLTLDLHVVLDGIDYGRAERVIAQMRVAYDPLHVTIKPTYYLPSLRRRVLVDEDGDDVHTNDVDKLFVALKSLFRDGKRPPGTDVVYLMTDRNLVSGGDDAVAGIADCIGGVRFPSRAFAMGEVDAEDGADAPISIGPVTFFSNTSAKIAAHEVAHLLGAQHHYANCAEGVTSEFGEASVCTLMFNDVGLVSLAMGTLEASVVRGHVEMFAAP
ncbi:MAG: hypothetical protein ABR520_08210 [Mycobacteriales bacterium]